MIRQSLAPLALIAALAACAQPGAERLSPADSLAIDSIRTAWAEAYNARNVDALAGLYTDDAVSYVGNQPGVTGRDAIRQAFTAEFAMPPMTATVPAAARIEGDDDMAVVAGPFTTRMGPDAGAMALSGKYLVVLKKNAAGRWLIAYASSSLDTLPPMPPAPAPARR
jgi:uncharacterized protein (TIGR02246 family)